MVLTVTLVTCLADRLYEQNVLSNGLFEQAPEAIVLMDARNRVLRINREFTAVFGYTAREAVNLPLADLIAPGDLRQEFERHAEMVAEGKLVDVETVRRRSDGTQIHVHGISVPISVPNGKVAFCAMYSDITERKAADAAVQSLSKRVLEVQEAERRHLARELHDEIGQLLTGLRLLLRLNGDLTPEAYRNRFTQARDLVDDLLGRVRGLSFDLRPADLDQLGLLPALLALFERYAAQTGVLVNFKHQGVEKRFSAQIETGAYRIVQEALTNTARHAGVGGVNVRVWADTEKLNLQIADRGCGFDADTVMRSPSTTGLLGMRERANALGGNMTVESAPGSGTTVTAELPLGPPN
jgi:PAS domain S-box-containing protein